MNLDLVTKEELAEVIMQMKTKFAEMEIKVQDLINSMVAHGNLPNKAIYTMSETAKVFDMTKSSFRMNLDCGYIDLPFFIPEGMERKAVCRREDILQFIAETFGKPGPLMRKDKALRKLGLTVAKEIKFKKINKGMKYEFCLQSDFEQFKSRMAS